MEPPQPLSHQNGLGSAESTPRSAQQADCWEDPLPQIPGAKLRLMCSYGGHIIPRPHDKSLCYVGGETRIIVVDRNSSLDDLCSRLSKTLLDGRMFSLKYQLPNEDLDSLISVATDEDLENMIEEYDRIMMKAPIASSGGGGGGRLRLFLFFAKPETAKTMGALLDDAKSETWFVDALNGANLLPRGLSDSAAIDDLLSLGSTDTGSTQINSSNIPAVTCSDVAPPGAPLHSQPKLPPHQDVHSIQSIMPDSPMIETTTSSFDSTTSSPSMAHLPPIRVRVDEGGGAPRLPVPDHPVGTGLVLEEQFSSQLRVSASPPLPTTILTQPSTVAVTNAVTSGGGCEQGNLNPRVMSDDERSDHAVAVNVSRKPPLPQPLQLQQPPLQSRLVSGGFNLPSPDSVASDSSSIASTASLPKVTLTQDPSSQVSNLMDNNNNSNKIPTTQPNSEPKNENQTVTTQNQTSYAYPPPPAQQQQHDHHQQQQQQPQYIQAAGNMHYIPAHTPVQSYYPVYPTQQPMHPTQVDPNQQYPMYLLPVPQTQPYNLTAEPTAISSATQAHVYPPRPGPAPQVPQYVNVGYNHQSAQTIPGNYGNYNYAHDHHQHLQHQVYYTGQVPATGTTTTTAVPVVASQYQSITPAQAAMIAEASMQLTPTAADSNKQPPRA